MKCIECFSDRLVTLPYNPCIYLCSDCRCVLNAEAGDLRRDYLYEEDWKKMASYVGKTYEQVFHDEITFAKSRAPAL